MVQVHVPLGVGVRVPPWAPLYRVSIFPQNSQIVRTPQSLQKAAAFLHLRLRRGLVPGVCVRRAGHGMRPFALHLTCCANKLCSALDMKIIPKAGLGAILVCFVAAALAALA